MTNALDPKGHFTEQKKITKILINLEIMMDSMKM